MKNEINLSFMILAFYLACAIQSEKTPRPNIILIIADDMGYGDIKRYNAKAKVTTPNLDQLTQQAYFI